MKKANYVRFKATGLAKELKRVLTSDWQASPLLASQVVVQPDAVARRMTNNRNVTAVSAKNDLICLAMVSIVRSGFAEKRKVNGRNEYRLTQPKETQ